MSNEDQYFIRYTLDGKQHETDVLYTMPTARIEKGILIDDGAHNVEIVKYDSVL